MFKRLVALLFLLFMLVTSIIFFVVAVIIWLLTVWVDRRLSILHQFTCFWGSLYLWVMPSWKVSVVNRERFRKGVTYVIVSNHQSQLDILVAFLLFRHFKWVSKAEVFKVPFIGWNMFLNGYIRLRRGKMSSIRKMYKDCKQALGSGSSVFMFPEGSRSLTGIPQKFHSGAFSLAKKAEVAILPIAISGTKDALPKKSFNFHGSHDIKIKVLDEIPFEEFKDMKLDELTDLVRTQILNALSVKDVVKE